MKIDLGVVPVWSLSVGNVDTQVGTAGMKRAAVNELWAGGSRLNFGRHFDGHET